MKRSYGQFCALAKALDVVGERWTLLLVRDLLFGPKRFSDLLDGLPGLGTGLLSQRLKELEQSGIVQRRRLAPPAGSTVYELTEVGRGLGPAVLELANWGVRFLEQASADDLLNPEWIGLYLQTTIDPQKLAGVHDAYEFRVDDRVFHFFIEDGTIEARQGPAPGQAALVVTTDFATFVEVGLGRLSPEEALATGRGAVEGDPDALLRALEILRPPAVEDLIATAS